MNKSEISAEKFSQPYEYLPFGEIKPQGWLRSYLETQMEGLTGHLNEIGYPFDTNCWYDKTILTKATKPWWPYEQSAYWIDGLLRCTLLLDNSKYQIRVEEIVKNILATAEDDGFIGPTELKSPGADYQWPHAVLFRGLVAYYDATGNKKVLDSMVNHFLLQSEFFVHRREVVNVETMLWLYERTGNQKLLDLALETYKNHSIKNPNFATAPKNLGSDSKVHEHGVTFNELSKIPTMLFQYTREQPILDAVIKGYQKLDKYHMLADGMHSSSEHLNGNGSINSHETCNLADYPWTIGYLFLMTGDLQYLDKVERACLNAAQGAVSADFKSFQYFSSPNQPIATSYSNHLKNFAYTTRMAFQARHYPECCAGNINRIMPNFIARMWAKTNNNGIAALQYGPCEVKTTIGKEKAPLRIKETTHFPFSETIALEFSLDQPLEFSLKLRIPSWCETASIFINGVKTNEECVPGTFVSISRIFTSGDQIQLTLPMEVKTLPWNKNGICVERGPLLFALDIQELWEKDSKEPRQTMDFPAWQVTPQSPWNYTLDLKDSPLADQIKVIHKDVTNTPWKKASNPIELEVPAKQVKGWKLKKYGKFKWRNNRKRRLRERKHGATIVEGPLILTPRLPKEKRLKKLNNVPLETIRLIPYGCTALRIAIFPKQLK